MSSSAVVRASVVSSLRPRRNTATVPSIPPRIEATSLERKFLGIETEKWCQVIGPDSVTTVLLTTPKLGSEVRNTLRIGADLVRAANVSATC